MIVHGLDESPEFEVFNEGNRKAFDNFKLRSNDLLEQLVQNSRHRHVLFKPLCDSHRVDELLDSLRYALRPRAIWAFRDFEGRVRSAVAKFGDSNLQVLREFAAGRGFDRWQLQRLSEKSIGFLKSLDLESMSAESGAAVMWLIRNSLYFELGLHDREDVMLVSYNRFISDPPRVMQALCSFIGFEYRPRLVRHVARTDGGAGRILEIDSRVREACLKLEERLSSAAEEKLTALSTRAFRQGCRQVRTRFTNQLHSHERCCDAGRDFRSPARHNCGRKVRSGTDDGRLLRGSAVAPWYHVVRSSHRYSGPHSCHF